MKQLFPYNLEDQIAAVEREIALRNRVYFRQVGLGKMTQDRAEREIALMQAVLETLKAVRSIRPVP